MSHPELDDGNSKIDAVIDSWVSRLYLEPKTASSLAYLTDLFHYEQNEEPLLDQDYRPVFNGSIGSDEIYSRFNRMKEEGNTSKRMSGYTDGGAEFIDFLEATPHWADLTILTEDGSQTVDETVAETYLWLEEQDIITGEGLHIDRLRGLIRNRPEYRENSLGETFRIEDQIETL